METHRMMLEEQEARSCILEGIPAPSSTEVPLAQSLGLRAAEEIRARVALPGFDNSQMDGYAVRSADAVTGARLRVVGEQPAGKRLDLRLGEGEAVRIFTGAPLPADADAVVMQEDVEDSGGGEILLQEGAEASEFVRRRGSDLCEGQVILRSGECITASRIGVLASQGIDWIQVFTPPSFSVITTGDELRNPGEPLEEGMIYNSNGPMLEALLREVGISQVHRIHAPDDPPLLLKGVEAALETSDMVLIAGGVSVGERDFVAEVLHEAGVVTEFWKVKVKPGKPFLFGSLDQKRIFGLPGNPVSSYLTFLLFVLPALKKAGGDRVTPEEPPLEATSALLKDNLENRGDRPHYVRGVYQPSDGEFFPVGRQESHALSGLSRANALVRLEAGESLMEDQEVRVFLLPETGR